MILPREFDTAAAPLGSELGKTPDTKPEARLDGVGIWWITFAAAWTILLASGMIFLYGKRNTPTLRLRGLPLTFAGIVFLHLYWLSVQIVYTVGPLAPEMAEFWIMSIWYPFGIALFQAGNSQFFHVAKAQSRFARPPSQMKTRYDEKQLPRKAAWLQRMRRMDYSKRMLMFVTIGMALQLLIVVVVFMISRKFHPEFGIPGTEVTGSSWLEIAMKQGRGWEWWPSIVWQFIWAWIVAPIILWRSRGIHDTHGWQRQTIACCIAGLPAAPMWLIALYVPEMAPVNQYFLPPQWIALTIFVMEVCTVFVPCWQVRKHQNLRQETLECIANWESKKRFAAKGKSSSDKSTAQPLSPTSTKVGEPTCFESWKRLPDLEGANSSQPSLGGISNDSVLTMAALEHVLDKNPEPLRQFSARRDFSGENIAFLTAVAEWKAALPQDFLHHRDEAAPDVVRQQFARALRIYTEFISPRDAEFPINIAWHDLRKLQAVFERAARSATNAAVNPAAPFAHSDSLVTGCELAEWPLSTIDNSKNRPSESQIEILEPTPAVIRAQPLTVQNHNAHSPNNNNNNNNNSCHGAYNKGDVRVHAGGGDVDMDIPQSFDATVFDAAYDSVKYLVLTNTWPKYVRERRSSESSFSSWSWAGSSYTGASGTTAAPSTAGTACGMSSRKEGGNTVGGVKGLFGRLFR
ncbi:hypothetical protein C8A03DRAFT_38379 [Achaetomium macrosporum]|uniref:RGS domain-containing protein n=1 Tax=Achaetomium macrosporum TaxID=79813 RepID=A0AAN7C2K7_9PEZI|nr:hypothetical protein C8A03DRAFT_38379 [Achaetomium macrosporum]